MASDCDAWSKYDVQKALSEVEHPKVSAVEEIELRHIQKMKLKNYASTTLQELQPNFLSFLFSGQKWSQN